MRYIVLLGILGVITGCGVKSSGESVAVVTPVVIPDLTPDYEEPVISEEEISEVLSVGNLVHMNGTIVLPPQQHVSLTLPIGGTIRDIAILSGEYVKKGSRIATLENPEFIELQQAWLEAAAQSEFLHAEYLRQQALSEKEAASKKRYQESKADYLSMKVRKEAAAAQLKLLNVVAEELLERGISPVLEVRAPASGYVGGLQVNQGKYLEAGEPLCEIMDKGQSLLCLTAYEKDLNILKPGSILSFRVNGTDDRRYSATLLTVGQQIDPVTRSLEVYARVNEGSDHFRPGMYVTAEIEQK